MPDRASACRSTGSTARAPGQAQKEAFVNEAFARLDALLQPVVIEERAAPPAAPLPGDCYLVADPGSGAWAGHARAIAIWAESQWLYHSPREGARVYDLSSQSIARYTLTGGWERISAPAAPAGGPTQDSEARAAIGDIIAALFAIGVFSA